MAMARAAEFSPVSCTILGEADPSVSVEGGLTSHTLGGWVVVVVVVVSGEEIAVVVVGGVVVAAAVVVVVPDGVGVNVGGDSAENSGD